MPEGDFFVTIAESFLTELEFESVSTRRVLERCPIEKFTWKPHAKSMSLVKLADHSGGGIFDWGMMILNTDELTIGMDDFRSDPPKDSSELLAHFEKSLHTFRAKLSGIDDEAMKQPWKLIFNGKAVIEMPRRAVLRSSVFNHLIHHRGQLIVYLRLLDVPVPGLYGPSADESVN